MSGALKPVASEKLATQYRIKPGDRLHRLVARLADSWIDDLSDARIVELEALVDSWRLTDSDGRRFDVAPVGPVQP